MRRSLIAALLLLVLLPVAGLGWLGLRLAAEEQAQTEGRFRELLTERLADSARLIAQVVAHRRQQLIGETARLAALPAAARREQIARTAALDQLFLLAPDGSLRHPDPAGPLTAGEREFLERTRRLWEERGRLLAPPPAEGGAAPERSGWYSWHWGNGLNLLFWQRLPDGGMVGAEVERLGLLAAVIAALPDQRNAPADSRFRLRDGRGDLLYQWGGYEPAQGEPARATLALAPPLESWQLELLTPAAAAGAGSRFVVITGVALLALVLLLAAVYLYRELTRALREAAQRVSFVNQVSHELKTPLTNIRLYAELAAADLEEDDEASRKLAIITAETRRLSRLIGNVLNFARGQRGALRLHPTALVPDSCIRELAEQFRPGFDQAGIALTLELAAPEPQLLDGDALTQILANLLSNVEKYAAAGGRVVVSSQQSAAQLTIRVRDFGPGIPAPHRGKVFRPFYRVRNDLTEGVSGTGIGLAIARELARLHGGELTLERCDGGALFMLSLPRTAPPSGVGILPRGAGGGAPEISSK